MRALWAASLLKLQEMDNNIERIRTRLGLLPAERKRIIAAKNAADQQLVDAEKKLAVHRDAIRKMESEAQTLEDKRNRVKQQSALVKKNDEYQTMMQESAMLEHAIGELESRILTEMERTPVLEKQLADTRVAVQNKIRALKKEWLEFGETEKSFQKDLADARTERNAAAESIDVKIREPYEELHRGKDGTSPVVAIAPDGSCGCCCLKLTPQTLATARAGKLVHCENCRHLVYFEDL